MVENRFFMTDNILKEFIYKVLCKKTIFYGSIISALSFLLAIYSFLDENSFMLGVFLVNGFICTSATIFTPILALKSFKKENTVKGFKEEIIINFTDEKISLKEGSYNVDIGYDNIQEIHKLTQSCVFMMSNTSGLIVSNDGFIKGSLDDCINLVNNIIMKSVNIPENI